MNLGTRGGSAMATRTVGIREFRDDLSADPLDSETPVPSRARRGRRPLLSGAQAANRGAASGTQGIRRASASRAGCERSDRRRVGQRLRGTARQKPTGRPLRQLVLDANRSIRAALGRRVLALLDDYGSSVALFAPDTAFDEAGRIPPARRRLWDDVEVYAADLSPLFGVHQAGV